MRLLITIFKISIYMYEVPHHDISLYIYIGAPHFNIPFVFLDTWGSSLQYSKNHIMCSLQYWNLKWILHHDIRNIPLYVFRNILLWERSEYYIMILEISLCMYFEIFSCENYTVNPALLTSSFVWQILLSLFHISLFKVIKRQYFSQGKCEFLIFLFVILDKIKIFTLETVYLPHQLLYMLFLAPLKNVWAIYGLTVKTLLKKC